MPVHALGDGRKSKAGSKAKDRGEVERLRAQNARLAAQLAQTRAALDIMGTTDNAWTDTSALAPNVSVFCWTASGGQLEGSARRAVEVRVLCAEHPKFTNIAPGLRSRVVREAHSAPENPAASVWLQLKPKCGLLSRP